MLKKSPRHIGRLLVVGCLMFATGQALGAPVGAPDAAPAGSRSAPEEPTVAERPQESPAPYTFVGTKRCRMCHTDQYESWLASRKAHSWEALKPYVSEEIKRKAGLDTARDYRADPTCLPCHSVGFGEPGGYAIPDPTDGSAKRAAANRQGVGCEACHGPGSGFVEVMRGILRADRTYVPAEVYAAGRRIVDINVCNKCHNSSAICQVGVSGGRPYNPSVKLTDRSGYHAAFPLPHRRGSEDAAGSPNPALPQETTQTSEQDRSEE